VAERRITPAEGQAIANILTGHAQALEAQELLRRVQQLEMRFQQMNAEPPKPSATTTPEMRPAPGAGDVAEERT
jgi:hypothetical protein